MKLVWYWYFVCEWLRVYMLSLYSYFLLTMCNLLCSIILYTDSTRSLQGSNTQRKNFSYVRKVWWGMCNSQFITHTHKEKESAEQNLVNLFMNQFSRLFVLKSRCVARHELIRRSNTHLRSIKDLKCIAKCEAHCKI